MFTQINQKRADNTQLNKEVNQLKTSYVVTGIRRKTDSSYTYSSSIVGRCVDYLLILLVLNNAKNDISVYSHYPEPNAKNVKAFFLRDHYREGGVNINVSDDKQILPDEDVHKEKVSIPKKP